MAFYKYGAYKTHPLSIANSMVPNFAITQQYAAYMNMTLSSHAAWSSAGTDNGMFISFWVRQNIKGLIGTGHTGMYCGLIITGDPAGVSHNYARFMWADHYWSNGEAWIDAQLSKYNGSTTNARVNSLGAALRIMDGNWHHFCAMGDMGSGQYGGYWKLYLDGVYKGTADFSGIGAMDLANGHMVIGNIPLANNTPAASAHNRNFQIADIGVWVRTDSAGSFNEDVIAKLANLDMCARSVTQVRPAYTNPWLIWDDFKSDPFVNTFAASPGPSWTKDYYVGTAPFLTPEQQERNDRLLPVAAGGGGGGSDSCFLLSA